MRRSLSVSLFPHFQKQLSVQLRVSPGASATRFVFKGKENFRLRNNRRGDPTARYSRRSFDGNVEFLT